jgi:hypothetical protein
MDAACATKGGASVASERVGAKVKLALGPALAASDGVGARLKRQARPVQEAVAKGFSPQKTRRASSALRAHRALSPADQRATLKMTVRDFVRSVRYAHGVRAARHSALHRRWRALGTRRLACGRRPARRTTSSASSRGDPDLAGDQPPGHRQDAPSELHGSEPYDRTRRLDTLLTIWCRRSAVNRNRSGHPDRRVGHRRRVGGRPRAGRRRLEPALHVYRQTAVGRERVTSGKLVDLLDRPGPATSQADLIST